MHRSDPESSPDLLAVNGVSARFGGVQALSDVSLAVQPGEICALIGPNGAGKTTLFNCISRVYEVAGGQVNFRGTDITRVPRHQIVGMGLARTFQNLGLLSGLSVLENMLLGAHTTIRPSFWQPLMPGSSQGKRERDARDRAASLLDWLGLLRYADLRTGDLPFGTLKRIELARALLAEPKLLLLDEPANGLAHGEVDELADLILQIRSRLGIAVLLVEHHMSMVMRISDSVAVLHLGRLIARGSVQEVRENPEVIAAYLGDA